MNEAVRAGQLRRQTQISLERQIRRLRKEQARQARVKAELRPMKSARAKAQPRRLGWFEKPPSSTWKTSPAAIR